jgi:hypothetical protein
MGPHGRSAFRSLAEFTLKRQPHVIRKRTIIAVTVTLKLTWALDQVGGYLIYVS